MAAISGEDAPREVWHKTLGHLNSDPETLFRAGQVSRKFKEEASDRRCWSQHRKSWSPEFCGSLRTGQDGKDSRWLYRRWHRGKHSKEDLVDKFAHDSLLELGSGKTGVKAIKLSQAGALVAWSVGTDKALLRTDVTTCVTRRWFTPQLKEGFSCLEVLNADGRVFTGGESFICWDPRQGQFREISNRLAFKLKYSEKAGGWSSSVTALLCDESSGQPKILTGGDRGDVCLWDVRQPQQYVTKYEQQGFSNLGCMKCLALESRHGTIISGGINGLFFWDFVTGDKWVPRGETDPLTALTFDVHSVAVGTERMIVGGSYGIIQEAIPDPTGGVGRRLQGVLAVPRNPLWFPPIIDSICALPQAMQGVGEGPAGILAGTADGSIGSWVCLNNLALAQQQCDHIDPLLHPPRIVAPVEPEELPAHAMWSLTRHPFDLTWAVTCLAATDEVVVNGFSNGKIRIVRMKEQY